MFLGTRLQCAKCHHHPYERWGQADYYGLAGFFTRLGRKNFGQPPPYYASATPTTGAIVFAAAQTRRSLRNSMLPAT